MNVTVVNDTITEFKNRHKYYSSLVEPAGMYVSKAHPYNHWAAVTEVRYVPQDITVHSMFQSLETDKSEQWVDIKLFQ